MMAKPQTYVSRAQLSMQQDECERLFHKMCACPDQLQEVTKDAYVEARVHYREMFLRYENQLRGWTDGA